MDKKIVTTVEDLESRLKTHIRNHHGKIAIIGGHFPIDSYGMAQVEEDDAFGIFPLFTLEESCKLLNYAKNIGKEAKLVLVIDDHSQQIHRTWYVWIDEKNPLALDPFALEIKRKVEAYFKNFSIPEQYKKIMQKHKIIEDDILDSQDHLLAFQESAYRTKFMKETGLDPGCAGEYRLILEEIAKKGFSKVIGFIPLQCQVPTCNAINNYNINVKNTPIKTINVYLSSNTNNWSVEEMLADTKEQEGGIMIFHSK